ncbi:hypothetical protein BX600DRAFT_211012 [Xylariales sp. PMI_506]|nr:hypothetical protein BX600DRAFT_211012 [Xylariales sp. PMI_506]
MSVYYDTFGSTISFKALERPQFAVLQSALFPFYFGIQTILPAVLVLTYPGNRIFSPGLHGVLDEENRWSVLLPIATVFASGLANWVYLLPAANEISAKRRAQEKKDGKRSFDAPPHSQEMVALNKRFGVVHGISSLLNLATLVATIAYGFSLSTRIQ